MLQTVKDISALDPLADLLESIESFLKHLDICTKVPHTTATTEVVMKTVVGLLSTRFVKQDNQVSAPLLAFYSTQCNAGIFVKKLFGGDYDQMVLERLD